jgi:hypothetical protein
MTHVTITVQEYAQLCNKANRLDKLCNLNEYESIDIPLYAQPTDGHDKQKASLYKTIHTLWYNFELWLFGGI